MSDNQAQYCLASSGADSQDEVLIGGIYRLPGGVTSMASSRGVSCSTVRTTVLYLDAAADILYAGPTQCGCSNRYTCLWCCCCTACFSGIQASRPSANAPRTTSSPATSSTATAACPGKSHIGSSHSQLASTFPFRFAPLVMIIVLAGCAFARLGYGTYTWAKSYDKWQNSKAGHAALGEHH